MTNPQLKILIQSTNINVNEITKDIINIAPRCRNHNLATIFIHIIISCTKVSHVIILKLKSDSHLPKKIFVFALMIDSPSKMMKNDFYFILIALFFSRCLNFCLVFLGMQKKWLDQKDKVISKFMTSQPGSQGITIHISFFKNYAENQTGKLAPARFLFF